MAQIGPTEQDRMAGLVDQLRQAPGLTATLQGLDGDIVQEALNGLSVHEIASNHRVSEQTVWSTLGRAAQAAAGHTPAQRPETGGLGSDTDPGVTGGYGDTGFGSLGNEPPFPTPEEPEGPYRLPPESEE